MEYQYSLNDIASKTKKSYQSIIALSKKNQEELKQYSKKYGRFIKYNQDGLNWFLSYYGLQEPQEPAEDVAEDSSYQDTIAAKDGQIAALEGEIEALKKELEEVKAEKNELLRQNGMTLLLLQQEKQQNILLLPSATKKSLGDKIRAAFHKGNQD